MLGLILKDLYNLKSMVKLYGLFAIFYTFMAITSADMTFLVSMLFILCAMIPLAAMSFDEKAKWDLYGLTMPVSRKDIVISKYLLSFVAIILATAFLSIVNIFVDGNFNKGFIGVGLMVLSLILPIHFKFGMEKGRVIMIMIYLIPTALFLIFRKQGVDIIRILDFILKIYTPLNAFIVVLLSLVVSINISLKVYEKKEV